MKTIAQFSVFLAAFPILAVAEVLPNHPPIGVADVATTPYHTAVTIPVLANDTDEDGDPLQIKFFSAPAASVGSVLQVGQSLVFTPAAGFSGVAQFAYRVYDGLVGADGDTAVSVTVGGRPPPEAVAFTNGPVNIQPSGARWAGFGVPSIYKNGEMVGFLARVASRGEVFSAVFTGPPSTLQMRVKTGDVAPGRLGEPQAGVFFTRLADPVFPQAPGNLFSDEETRTLFAVPARVGGLGIGEGNDTGLWMVPAPGKPFQLLAREGEIAPGTHARFDAFGSLAMPMFSGRVFFTARLRGPGLHAGNDAGLWIWTLADGLRLVLRTGSPVDLQNGESATLAAIQVLGPSAFAPGRGGYERVFGQLDALLRFTDGLSAAALIGLDGRIDKLLLSKEPTVSGSLVVTKFGVPAWRWEASGVSYPAVVATLEHGTAGVTAVNDLALIDRRSVLARKGARTGLGDSVFSSFADPVKGFGLARPLTLYQATIAGLGIDVRNNTVLFAADDPDGFTTPTSPGTVIARTGDVAPGGGQFSRLLAHTIIPGRGPAFTASLRVDGKTVTPDTCMGFWATDTRGRVSRILRTGESVKVGATVKKLRRFDVLGNVPGSPGQCRATTQNDPEGRLIYRAFFTDLTSAIMTTTLP